MTSDTKTAQDEKVLQTLEEICENTRAIRRVTNRILDHLKESYEPDHDYDPDQLGWEDLDECDDMYY